VRHRLADGHIQDNRRTSVMTDKGLQVNRQIYRMTEMQQKIDRQANKQVHPHTHTHTHTQTREIICDVYCFFTQIFHRSSHNISYHDVINFNECLYHFILLSEVFFITNHWPVCCIIILYL